MMTVYRIFILNSLREKGFLLYLRMLPIMKLSSDLVFTRYVIPRLTKIQVVDS